MVAHKLLILCVSIMILALSACNHEENSDDGNADPRTSYQCCSNLTSSGSPTEFDEIEVGSTASATITISNQGTGTAMELDILSTGAPSAPYSFVGGIYPGTNGTCGTELVSNASCTVELEFAPTTSGEHISEITLEYYSGSTLETASVALNGTSAVAAPQITSLSPISGSFAGGDTVTFTGSNFVDASTTSITFNGLACSNYAVTSATSMTCTTPGGTTVGAVDIVITNTTEFSTMGTSATTSSTVIEGFTFVESSFGNGALGDVTITSNIELDTLYSALVTNIDTSTGKTLTLKDSGSGGSLDYGFAAGDELLWHVSAASSDTACGGGLNKGNWGFARVVSSDNSALTVVLDRDITSGNSDTITNSALAETDVASNANTAFCSLHIQEVANYKNLTVSDSGSGITVTPSPLGNNHSGILAIKVSETLTATGDVTFSANAAGYSGGTGYNVFITGTPGSGDGTNGTGSGGSAAGNPSNPLGGGGGGNAAAGGVSGDGTAGGLANTCASSGTLGSDCLFHGGGGGAGTADSNADDGTDGGGIVIIFAANTSGDFTVSANANEPNQNSDGHFGGGAGGAVFLALDTISSGTPTISVNGGSGHGYGQSGGVDNGGGGGSAGTFGGGFCVGSVNMIISTLGGSGGVASASDGIAGGNFDNSSLGSADTSHDWCNQ